jgi:hypothetical protein
MKRKKEEQKILKLKKIDCKYFNTKEGCLNGDECLFKHIKKDFNFFKLSKELINGKYIKIILRNIILFK